MIDMKVARRSAATAVVTFTVAAIAGCTGTTPDVSPSSASSAAPTATAQAAAPATCADGKPVVASVAPGKVSTDSSTWPSGSRMAQIVSRKRLVVGTSGDAKLWGATNLQDGSLEGYDVDLAAAIVAPLGLGRTQIEYKVLALSDRQAALNRPVDQGGVDIVAERMTITCARWQGTSSAPAINFSTEYYVAGQKKLLVRSKEEATAIGDFKNRPVCGVTGSSSLASIEGSGARIVTAPTAGQCLVKFQEGEAVAITGDDTTLAGLQAQDTSSRIVGPTTADVPYGLGLPPGDPAFAQFVNGVLERLRSERTLQTLYERWMKNAANGGTAPATSALYGRDIPALKQKVS